MRLYSSLSRRLEELPAPPERIGMYVCGITPYASPHLGHARAAVVFDALVRFLRSRGRTVTYIRNLTDIDDKIIAAAAGGDLAELTARHIAEYHAMTGRFGCLPPDGEPKVSAHIPEIIALTERLIANGHAYPSAGSVYFSVRSFPTYGSLSGRDIDELIAGARVEPGAEKRDPLDFALWKAAKPGEPSWESPWGAGRPGWHIECSAMSMKYLGESFAIHGGGNDLIFPHHENERAQSEAATGKPFARIWMHNGMITLAHRKMSKSEGNTLDPLTLAERFGARTLRFAMLAAHYRSPLDFSEERLAEAATALERFDTFRLSSGELPATGEAAAFEREFTAALEDDFNTARALAALFEAVKEGNKAAPAERGRIAAGIVRCGDSLGLELLAAPAADGEIDRLVAERDQARRERDFARADEIRKLLSERGVIIEDTAQGTRWRR